MKRFSFHVYTCISLADFNEAKKNTETEAGINKIEKSIVQQILYRTSSESTPNSRFRRIFPKPFSYFESITQAFALLLWIFMTSVAVSSQEWTLNTFYSISKEINFGNADLWITSYLITLPLLLLKDLIKSLGPITLTKMNVFQTELAFDKERNDSVFNTYLEEIIYYFSVTKSDVVIFEDLDRLEESNIFIKLKELNKLINDSKDVRQDVRFIYAIKDELFTGKDRTKFFDSIIPIIPVSHRSNSYPQLKALLKSSNLLFGLKDDFLRDVSIYLDDMRMIKNIVTEYAIYKSTYENNFQKLELYKLFSFIVYKNLYCDDFAKLNSHEGVLASLVDSIHGIRKSYTEKLERERNAIRNELIEADQEMLSTVEELNAVYVSIVFREGYQPQNGFSLINGIPFTELSKIEPFDTLYQSTNNVLLSNQHGQRFNLNKPFRSWSDQMSPSYDERRKIIQNKKTNNRELKNAEIRDLEEKLQSVRNMSIKELIGDFGKENVFKDVKSEALIHLVGKGYLDEHYHFYISHFREGQLSKSDMDFVMTVKNRVRPENQQALSNCEEITRYFSQSDYTSPAILNPDLINYLLLKNLDSALNDVIRSTILSDENRFGILNELLGSINSTNRFVAITLAVWPDIWQNLIASTQMTNENKIELILKLIVSTDKTAPKEVAQFIEEQNISPLFPQDETKASIVYSKLTSMNVRFKFVPRDGKFEFMENILTNNLFAKNFENITAIFGVLCGKTFSNQINFRDIYDGAPPQVQNYVYENINYFAELISHRRILLNSDSEFAAILTDTSILDTHKIEIINNCEFQISSLEDWDINEELISHIFLNQRIVVSWVNLSTLLGFENLKDVLYDYLNFENVFETLSKQDISTIDDGSFKEISKIILLQEINLNTFKCLLPLFVNNYNPSQFNEFSSDRLRIYLDLADIESNELNFSAIRSCDIALACKFLEDKFKSFKSQDLLPKIDLDPDDVIALLKSHALDTTDKQYLINVKKDKLTLTSDTIEYIIPTLIEPPLSDIPRLTLSHITTLLTLIPSERDRVLCLIGQIRNVENNSIWPLLELLGNEFKQLTQSKGSLYLNRTDYSLTLMSLLKNRDIISSYSSVERNGKQLIKVNLKRI